jgi:hypothetical protein
VAGILAGGLGLLRATLRGSLETGVRAAPELAGWLGFVGLTERDEPKGTAIPALQAFGEI